uniref:Uncharacterized protein n=1 Tax=Trichobilharzia regenti TaxID=157069 RepID=A0AA85IUD9_TRIRE|nr:unnamed protein product [Trichobilharzia regenti]
MKFSLIQLILLAIVYGTKAGRNLTLTIGERTITNLIDSQPVGRIFDEWFETVREDYMKELDSKMLDSNHYYCPDRVTSNQNCILNQFYFKFSID